MASTPYPLPRETRESGINIGDGSAGPYGPSQYRIFDVDDVKVFARAIGEPFFQDVTDTVTVAKTTDAGYDTFSVTFSGPIGADIEWFHAARRVAERSVAVTRGGTVNSDQTEKELSKIATTLSEVRRDLGRTLQVEPGEDAPKVQQLPSGHFHRADDDGNLVDAGLALPLPAGGIKGQVLTRDEGPDGSASWTSNVQGGGDMLASAYDPDAKVAGYRGIGSAIGTLHTDNLTSAGALAAADEYLVIERRTSSDEVSPALYETVGTEPTMPLKVNIGGFWKRYAKGNDFIKMRHLGAKMDGIADDTQPMKDAIEVGKEIGLPIYLPGRAAVSDTLLTGTVSGVDIFGDGPNGSSRILHNAVGKPLFQPIGSLVSLVSGIAITAPVPKGSRSFPVVSTSGLSVGQRVLIHDASQKVYDGLEAAGPDLGEWVTIRSIDSGAQFSSRGLTTFSYTTSAVVRALTPVRGFSLRNLTIENEVAGQLGGGSVAISMFQVERPIFSKVLFKGLDEDAVRAEYSIDGYMNEVQFEDLHNDLAYTPYGLNLSSGSAYWQMNTCDSRGAGRHIFTAGAGAGNIEPYGCLVTNSMVREASSASFDTHPGSRDIVFSNNMSFSSGTEAGNIGTTDAVQIRGRRHRVLNHTAIGCDGGVKVINATDCEVAGGSFRDCNIAITIAASPRTIARNIEIFDPKTNGVLISKNGSHPMAGLTLDKINVHGNPAGAAFSANVWLEDWEASDIWAFDAAALTDNIPHGIFYGSIVPILSAGKSAKATSLGRDQVTDTLSALTSGTMHMTRLEGKKGTLVSKLIVAMAAAPVSQTHFVLALYSQNMNLLGQTTDLGSIAATSGYDAYPLVSSVRLPYTGNYYIGIIQVAVTPSTVRGVASTTSLTNLLPKMAFLADTGLTDTAPSTATTSASSSNIAFVGIA